MTNRPTLYEEYHRRINREDVRDWVRRHCFGEAEEDDASIEGRKERLAELNMSGEAIYHPRPFAGICKDCTGSVDILE